MMLRFSVLALLVVFLASCNSYKIVDRTDVEVRQITESQVIFKDGSIKKFAFAKDTNTTRLVLVRHAEKAYGEDAGLLPPGKRRALLLADILDTFPLDTIYATKYRRTQLTAKPTAKRKSMEVAIYDLDEPTRFVQRVLKRQQGYNILVAGHSNTTPDLINRFLGKEELERIDERDYNNLYILGINEEGEKELLKLRFSFDKENID